MWFDNRTVAETGFGTFDKELWSPLLSAESALDPKLALERMGLLAPDGNGVTRATVAGVLLCVESPEQFLPIHASVPWVNLDLVEACCAHSDYWRDRCQLQRL